MTDDHLYRRGVGVMLINADGQVWVGRRIDNRDEAWQMPQGGLDKGEEPLGGRAARARGGDRDRAASWSSRSPCHPQQLRYDIPDAIAAKLWGGKWKGQMQDWYLARFLGDDERHRHRHRRIPSSAHWKWVEPRLLPELIVPFKRDMYRAILEGFAEWL